jgi:hypothetical protein
MQMTPEEFETTKAIFDFAKKGLRNDESLGDFLVDIGAKLVALGVRENKELRKVAE